MSGARLLGGCRGGKWSLERSFECRGIFLIRDFWFEILYNSIIVFKRMRYA